MIGGAALFSISLVIDAFVVGVSELEPGVWGLLWAIIGALIPILSIIYFTHRLETRKKYRQQQASAED